MAVLEMLHISLDFSLTVLNFQEFSVQSSIHYEQNGYSKA